MLIDLTVIDLSGFTSRRQMLNRCFNGIGSLALGALVADEAHAAKNLPALASKTAHFAPRAKRCIFLFMSGGVSQVDTFEHKPALTKYAGKTIEQAPDQRGEIAAALTKDVTPFPELFPFERFGRSGRQVSSRFEHLGRLVDDLAFVHGIVGESNNHGPATLQTNTGSVLQGSPCVGHVRSWK